MEGACTLFNFHDAVHAPDPQPSLVFFDDIVDLPHHIDWPGDEPANDILSLDMCPNPQAYNAALLGKVDLVPHNSHQLSRLFLIPVPAWLSVQVRNILLVRSRGFLRSGS